MGDGPNIKHNTIKLKSKKHRRKYLGPGLGKEFTLTPKACSIKGKIGKLRHQN